MMATAREQAQTNLGSIRDYVNYGGYQAERDNAQNNYDTSIKSLEDKYNSLVDTINTNRNQLYRDLTSGRTTVANDYYSQKNLNNGSNLSSYLRNTGVGSLNNVLNRMNLGNENSKLANTYYRGQDELNTQLDSATKDYDINRQNARNNLDSLMASINAREKEAENDYNNKLASLAEQIQQRWDNDANAKAALAEQKRYNNASLDNQLKSLYQTLNARLSEIAGANPTYKTYLDSIRYYLQNYATNAKDRTIDNARNYLASIGIYAPDDFDRTFTMPNIDDIIAGKYPNVGTNTSSGNSTSGSNKPSSKPDKPLVDNSKPTTNNLPSGIDMSWADRYNRLR